MEIRDAILEDFEQLLPLARQAHEDSILGEFPMNEAQMQRIFVTMMAFPTGYARVMTHKGKVVGGLVGAVSENQYGIMCASDIFNFSMGGTDRLIRDFKGWAKNNGAQYLHITDLCGRDRYHAMLSSQGLQQCGINFVGV